MAACFKLGRTRFALPLTLSDTMNTDIQSRTRTTAACLCLLWLLAGLVVLPGCSSRPQGVFPIFAYSDDGELLPKPSSAGLVVDPTAEIQDVPRPVGFVGVPSKSTSSVDPITGVRTVIHIYQGRSNTQDAARYFRRNLDDYNWKLDGFDTGDPRATIQSYVKGPEQLRITITGDRGITTLTILISPVAAPTY